ncbi:hypothetical protein [Hallella colorans]|uniref:hypothetical protein n=1 Tax=Hallella colorans TaxID=1703337 RepID=UPI0023F24D7D|nr:hypothetical protein [Hallella colorans]
MALFGKHKLCRGLAHATSNVIQKKYLILRLQSNSINLDLSLKKYYHPLCLCTTYHLDNGVEQAGNGIQDSFVYLYQTTPQAPKGCVCIMDVNVFFDCLQCKNINIVCNLPQDFDAAISDSEARNKFTKQSASLENIENLPKRCGQNILINKLNGMKCL